jgi:hypothetical protein
MGSNDNDYVRAVTRMTFVACVGTKIRLFLGFKFLSVRFLQKSAHTPIVNLPGILFTPFKIGFTLITITAATVTTPATIGFFARKHRTGGKKEPFRQSKDDQII